MPITLPTLRKQNSSGHMKFTFLYGSFNNISLPVNIPLSTYTTIDSLLTDINTSISSALTSNAGVSIVFSSVSFYVGNICSITYNCTSFTLENSPLVIYILGFTNRYTSTNSPLQSTAAMSLYGLDNIIYITFHTIPNSNINSITYKTNDIIYYNDSTEHQSISLNNSNFTLDKLNILVSDRLGCPLAGYHNFTMSLIIEYDEEHQQQFFNFNN